MNEERAVRKLLRGHCGLAEPDSRESGEKGMDPGCVLGKGQS